MSTRGRVTVLPRAIAAWRKDVRKWTQKELAARASEVARRATGDINSGVSASAVAMIEAGDRQPSVEVLGWIADALGVEVDVLALVDAVPAVLSVPTVASA